MRMSRRDLYALGEPFGSSATQLKAGGKSRIYGGGDGGGSSGPTQTTVQNTNLPDYVQPYVMSMLGGAMNQVFNTTPDASGNLNINSVKGYQPYSTNASDYVAAFSPLQQQAQNTAANMQVPGQFTDASNATQAAMNQLASNQYNPLASNYMSTQAPNLRNYQMQGASDVSGAQMQGVPNVQGPGMQASNMQGAQTSYNPQLQNYQMGPASNVTTQDFTQGNTAARFMNPYIQQSLDPQLAEIQRQYGVTGQQEQSAATNQGAMGGSREALMAAENQRNSNLAQNAAITQGYNTAYQQAQQQFNTQQQANLQAQQANQNAGLTVGQQNLAAKLGIQQLGTQTGVQTALANLTNAQQAAVQNQAAQNQAAGMNAQQAMQAALANQQAGLTTSQQNAQMQQQANLANQQNAYNTQNTNLQARLGVQSLGSGQNMQSQLANQQAYAQAQQLAANQQQFGANYGLQNLQQYLSGANQLGNLGNNQLAAQQNILNTQNTIGGQQQNQQQQVINNAINNYAMSQQYPQQQYAFLNSLLRGLPMQSGVTQTYQAAPSTISQLGGLAATGIGAYGALSKREGGVIGMKSGGLVDLALKNAMEGAA